MTSFSPNQQHEIIIPSGKNKLNGLLYLPENAVGFVIFVHGSGSGRLSSRNQLVAHKLNEVHLGTLLFDLLTDEEDRIDNVTREYRFDMNLLSSRLIDVTRWCQTDLALRNLKMGYFGASTGGGAALMAAARLPDTIHAVVSRGGRPDLAGEALTHVLSPTLLLVGELDDVVIQLNNAAMLNLQCVKKLEIIPSASHLFEEDGALDKVAQSAGAWLVTYLSNSHKSQ